MTRHQVGGHDLPPGPALDLVDLFRRLGQARKLSNGQIAVAAGVSRSHVSEVLRGVKPPSPDMAQRLARALDAAPGDVRTARVLAEKIADAKADARRRTRDAGEGTPARGSHDTVPDNGGALSNAWIVIDDVLVTRGTDTVLLDVRVRNAGTRSANITRVALRLLERSHFLTSYVPSATYDLLVESDVNEMRVAHFLAPDTVDQFLITLGFSPAYVGYAMAAQLEIRYNRSELAVSGRFTLDSCFG